MSFFVFFLLFLFFFFNDTATTEIYTLSLHDALPIFPLARVVGQGRRPRDGAGQGARDRKSTRLNSSHANISYAVFCLKKKNKHNPLSIHRIAQKKNKNTIRTYHAP